MPRTINKRHIERVTLNLIRYAHCCPKKLRPVLAKLADKCGWHTEQLKREEIELIYALVDDQLAQKAAAEYTADTESIVDHRHCDATCKLCGQEAIRFEFTLKNECGGTDHTTGSSCIEEYGLSVDGEITVEEALKRLHAAIARAKRRAERDDWQAAHPDHKAEFALLEEAYEIGVSVLSWEVWERLPSVYQYRRRDFVQRTRRLLKFYEREGYLRLKRTPEVYGPDGLLDQARSLKAEYDAARRWGAA